MIYKEPTKKDLKTYIKYLYNVYQDPLEVYRVIRGCSDKEKELPDYLKNTDMINYGFCYVLEAFEYYKNNKHNTRTILRQIGVEELRTRKGVFMFNNYEERKEVITKIFNELNKK